MNALKKIQSVTDIILKVAIVILFLAMFGVTTANVFMRYVVHKPMSFAVEFGRYTFISIVYLGSIFVMRDDGHIGLDIIVNMLPKTLGTIIKKITRVLVMIYLGLFMYESTLMVMTNWGNRSSTMQLPMSVVYCVMVIGSVGMFIEEFLHLIGVNNGSSDATEAGGGM